LGSGGVARLPGRGLLWPFGGKLPDYEIARKKSHFSVSHLCFFSFPPLSCWFLVMANTTIARLKQILKPLKPLI